MKVVSQRKEAMELQRQMQGERISFQYIINCPMGLAAQWCSLAVEEGVTVAVRESSRRHT